MFGIENEMFNIYSPFTQRDKKDFVMLFLWGHGNVFYFYYDNFNIMGLMCITEIN